MTENLKVLIPSDNFEQLISQSDIPVIVEFYADWCGPCRKLGPVLQEKLKTKKFKLIKVNVDDHPELAQKYVKSAIPFTILFKNGKKVTDILGYDTNAINNMINSL
jgi:thioredoxin 1